MYGCDYYPIQWDVDSLDWKNYGVQNIIDTVCNHKSLDCGSIILCHLGAKYTSQAVSYTHLKAGDKVTLTVARQSGRQYEESKVEVTLSSAKDIQQ